VNGLPEGWSYDSHRMELICPHGVGHPVPWSTVRAHGCDGCCSTTSEEDSKWSEALDVIKEESEWRDVPDEEVSIVSKISMEEARKYLDTEGDSE